MPGNPNATPDPPTRPSWLNQVLLAVVDSIESHHSRETGDVATRVVTDLYDSGWLHPPEGYQEPTDTEQQRVSEEALEWFRSL